MLPRIKSFFPLLLFVILTGCGGGGGASSGGNSLVYTGVSESAQITSSNAEELAIGAFEGGPFNNAGAIKSQSVSSAPKPQSWNTLLLAKILKQTSSLPEGNPGQASTAKAADGAVAGDDSCPEGPGKLEYSLSYNIDYTAEGVFIYNGYCSRGTRLTGHAYVGMLYDSETLTLSAMIIAFEGMTITSVTISGAKYFEAGGSILYYNILESSYNEAINMLVRDRNSPRTYKTENLETFNSAGAGYIDVSVTGGVFYHPDYGYVNMSTSSPLRFYDNAELPGSGAFQITGGSGSKSLVSFFASDLYRVQADTDGNGTYDFDSGIPAGIPDPNAANGVIMSMGPMAAEIVLPDNIDMEPLVAQ